jgi:hypothetical protein
MVLQALLVLLKKKIRKVFFVNFSSNEFRKVIQISVVEI